MSSFDPVAEAPLAVAPATGLVASTPPSIASRLRRTLAETDLQLGPAAALTRLVRLGLDRLPLPGSGATLARWQALAAVAEYDLSLAKLYEGHTDALAILAEVGDPDGTEPGASWGVWAAEAPAGRTLIESINPQGDALLGGAKSWCSGAAGVSHALLTAWHADGRGPQLVRLALRQPGVRVEAGAWHAVGMAGSASLDVHLKQARARCVGAPGDYLARPGFWQGGAGVAACWHGGATALARTLRLACNAPAEPTPFRLAALGRVDLALQGTAALLREAAAWIDARPDADASQLALRVRLAAEASARRVLEVVGRSLGAAPFCRDERFARLAADLPVFIRQSHAENDLAALGERVRTSGSTNGSGADPAWTL